MKKLATAFNKKKTSVYSARLLFHWILIKQPVYSLDILILEQEIRN